MLAFFLLLLPSLTSAYLQSINIKGILPDGETVEPHYHYNEGYQGVHRYRRELNSFQVGGEIHYLSHDREQIYASDEDTKKICEGQLKRIYDYTKKRPNVVTIVDPGDTVMLQCHYCAETQAQSRSARMWFKATHSMSTSRMDLSEVELDMHDDEEMNRVYTDLEHTLIIRNFQFEDAGVYFCQDYEYYQMEMTAKGRREFHDVTKRLRDVGKYVFLYHIDVYLRKPENTIVVSREQGSYLPKPSKQFRDENANVILKTEWSRWSPCSVCGDAYGERKRRGTCKVRKIARRKRTKPDQLDYILDVYPMGAPCHSSLFHDIKYIASRPEEIDLEKCRVKCMHKGKNAAAMNFTKFEKIDDIKIAKKIEQKKKKVVTQDLTEVEGKTIRLVCPGATLDTAVSWQNGTTLLRGRNLEKDSGGRVTIDMTNSLVIRNLTTFDAHEYTCWHDSRRQGSFKITVTEKPRVPEEDMLKGLAYLGMSYAFSFAVFLTCLLVKHRQRMVQVRRKR